MINSQKSDTEKINIIEVVEEGKKQALLRLLNTMKLLIKV